MKGKWDTTTSLMLVIGVALIALAILGWAEIITLGVWSWVLLGFGALFLILSLAQSQKK